VFQNRMGRALTPHARANFSVWFRASFGDPEFRAEEPHLARLEEIACHRRMSTTARPRSHWPTPAATLAKLDDACGRRANGRNATDPPFTTHPKDIDMKTLLALITAIALGALAGCNTMEGVGQDVSATGRAVEKAADKAKP